MATPSQSDVFLNKLVGELVAEQRRSRRWNLLFRAALLVYLVVLLVLYTPGERVSRLLGGAAGERHTAVVHLEGSIVAGGVTDAGRIGRALRRAFENPGSAGVVLAINSPGGSAVQSGIIVDEMRRLRERYPAKPLYAVVGDMAASGGYYVAVGADSIYVDKASLVGSIGVILASFGFVDAMDRVGVERRLITAGENKALLDPFSPQDPRETRHLRGVLAGIHAQFVDEVREGRGARLGEASEDSLFGGLVWTGEQAIELGLVDALGSIGSVARDVVGAPRTVDYSPRQGLLDQLSGGVAAALAPVLDHVAGGVRLEASDPRLR